PAVRRRPALPAVAGTAPVARAGFRPWRAAGHRAGQRPAQGAVRPRAPGGAARTAVLLQLSQWPQFGGVRLLPLPGGAGRARSAAPAAPDLDPAGLPSRHPDRAVAGLSGRALAQRCGWRRAAGGRPVRRQPGDAATARTAARPAGPGLVADPAGRSGAAWRGRRLGTAGGVRAVSVSAHHTAAVGPALFI